MSDSSSPKFTTYERFVIFVLAFMQFTVVLDFMVLSPLSAILLDELSVTTRQFGIVVSAYAFSAGVSAIFSAGFADRFDRKKLLLFFYIGFIIGTLLCGLATSYTTLLLARIITGIFGGVLASVSSAIVTDLFPYQKRGQVMGYIQMAFASSQVLGLPVGVYLATHFDWHAPFLAIVAIACLVGLLIFIKLRPVNEHLKHPKSGHSILHLWRTISNISYGKAFLATTFLTTGGYMLMPFGAAFAVNNLGIPLEKLPTVYIATGLTALVAGPIVGKLADTVGKLKIFTVGSIFSAIILLYYCFLGQTPLWFVILLNCTLFIFITSRMISSQAMLSAIPVATERGAFMGVNSALQQLSGGLAATLAGFIVYQDIGGQMMNYGWLGIVVTISIAITYYFMWQVSHQLKFAKEKE